jgi:thiamine kinase-like enzyme
MLKTKDPAAMNAAQRASLEQDVAYWENSAAIQQRYEAIHNSSTSLVLFLEFFPKSLHSWMNDQAQPNGGNPQRQHALSNMIKQVDTSVQFMKNNNFIHFDTHLENIVTDGNNIYLTDFGLSLSADFDLSPLEQAFFETHRHYDECCMHVNILHSLLKPMFFPDSKNQNDFKDTLQRILNGNHQDIPNHISLYVKKFGAIALLMDDFFQGLIHQSKQTPYPADRLAELLMNSHAMG